MAGYDIARRQMKGFGGMLTLDINSGSDQASRVADSLRLIRIGPSLGGAESLCTQPVTTSHVGLTDEELNKRGITPSMLRVSIGFEDPEDLLSDIRQALSIL